MLSIAEITIQLGYFEKAIAKLNEAILHDDGSEFLRESIIQRFEYCIELAWKTTKKLLEVKFDEVSITSPKASFKSAAIHGLIDNVALWCDFVDIRNKLSHIYETSMAEESYFFIKNHYTIFQALYTVLHSHVQTMETS